MKLSRSRQWLVLLAALWLCIAVPVRTNAQWEGPPADLAELFWRQGYALHMFGAYEQAIVLFKRSIEERPTAEGYTFLGWSLMRMPQEGIGSWRARGILEVSGPSHGT